MLSVCQVLHVPAILLGLQVLCNKLVVLDLLSTSGIDLVNSLWLESLEVIWDIAVLGKLRSCGHWILSHEVGHISSRNLLLVHVLLVISPSFFPSFLLFCQHLVVGLHFLQLLILLIGHFVFQ